jgi:branched-chain amino acid transport system ATP-binding protein
VTPAALEVNNITVRFGGITAVNDASLKADLGSVTGLIGPNGAGKTTLFNVITGVQPCNGGTVRLDGTDITNLPPHRRARLGMARTFQRLELFWTLNVADNVRVAAELAAAEDPDAAAASVLERIGIAHLANEPAGELPTGYARLVELARALARQPQVLLLDEPASGLNEGETLALGSLLRSLADEGLAVVLVEHDMSLVMQTCHRVAVLDLGSIIAEGSPDEVRRHPAVVEAYLGVT